MTTKAFTLADLRNAGIINSLEIVSAIDYFVLDPVAPPYRFASGHTLDGARILAAEMTEGAQASPSSVQHKTFRTKVAAAIMVAHPVSP